MTKFKFYIFITLFLLFISNAYAGEEVIQIHDAWIKEGPPSSKVLAGYLSIENSGEKKIVIIGVESPSFDKVMIHKSEVKDGFASMVHVEKLEIPPKTIFVFKAGAYHLMLHKPKRQLKAGDKADFTIHFSSGEKVTVKAVVKRDSGSMDNHKHH